LFSFISTLLPQKYGRIILSAMSLAKLGEAWSTFKIFNNGPEPDWKIEEGVLKGHWPFWGVQLTLIKEYPSLNYTIQVDCRIDEMGLLAFACIGFRVSKPDFCPSFYGFGISASQSGFIWDPGCNVTQVPGADIARRHKVGQWYTMKLVAKGSKFVGYVDDDKVFSLKDERYKGKFVGLITGPHTDVSFDNFMITDQVDDDAFADFDVSPEVRALTTMWAGLKILRVASNTYCNSSERGITP
jgi:3-keto-disaccharide hydrolase